MTKYLRATAMAGLSFVAATALADSVPEIVVEAAAPVNHKPTGEGSPGGAEVDLASVRYHVHLGDLDLTKHADVIALEQKIKDAARKACKDIQKEYPVRQMSDETSCINDAVKSAMPKVQDAITSAQKKSG